LRIQAGRSGGPHAGVTDVVSAGGDADVPVAAAIEEGATSAILIVDDDAEIRQMLAEGLRAEGYAVTTAASGNQALGILQRSGPFALILLDMRMPEMDGFEFAARYHELPEPHAPLLVFTADDTEDAAAHAESVGAVGYLTKPFDFETLLTLLTHCLWSPSRQPEHRLVQ
jgi:CheY-like chemotaxis protein